MVKIIRPNEYARAGENGKGLQYTYDAQGRVLTVIRADGTIQESNVYDAEGNLIHTQDGMGNGADMEYDLGGRRTKISTRGKASQQYEYDAFGNITGITDGTGNRTVYILDNWGRIVEIRQADGNSECYGYDYAGNMTYSTDGEGNTTTYEYSGIDPMMHSTEQRKWRLLTGMCRSTATMQRDCAMRWRRTEGLYSSSSEEMRSPQKQRTAA